MPANALPVRLTVLASSDKAAAVIAPLLPEADNLRATVVVRPADDAGLIPACDILMVQADNADWPLEERVAALISLEPSRPVIVLCGESDAASVRTLMRVGAVDVLPGKPTQRDLADAIATAIAARSASGASHRGHVISVLKSGGGSGATTLAVHTAVGLAHEGHRRTCLIDLDIQYGNVACYLDLDQTPSVIDLLVDIERVDGTALRGSARTHSSGLDVLPAPISIVPLEAVTPAEVQRLIALASANYDHVVIDLPHAWTAWSREVMAASDTIMLVTQLSVPSLRQARRQIATLAEEGLSQIPLTVVANRSGSGPFGGMARLRKAERLLGRDIRYAIGSDFKAMARAIDAGMPLFETRGNRRILRQFRELIGGVKAAPVAAGLGSTTASAQT